MLVLPYKLEDNFKVPFENNFIIKYLYMYKVTNTKIVKYHYTYKSVYRKFFQENLW